MVFICSVIAVTTRAVAQTPLDARCDLDVIRAHAEKSYPSYGVEVGRGAHGIVTLRFTSRTDRGSFAIALRALGTQLSTSMMAEGLDEAEQARVAGPVATWWRQADLQRTVAACTVAAPDSTQLDLAAAARDALRPIGVDGESSPLLRAPMLLGIAWIALAVLLLVALLQVAHTAADRAALVGLFACSGLLNWLLCVGGPGDLRLNLAAIWWGGGPELRWGPAPVELFRLLAFVLGDIGDVHIRWVNLALSSLVPVLLYAIVVELGIGKTAALLAAVVTAAHPLLIAFSADLGRQPTYLFAAFGSILGLLVFLTRGGIAAICALVVGTILAVASRPEGGHVFVLDATLLLLAPAPRRRRGAAALVVMLLAGFGFAYVRYMVEYGGLLATESHPLWVAPTALLWTVLLDRNFTPLAWILVWTIGILSAARTRAAWIALCILAGLHIAWSATGLYTSFVGYDRQVASARYESVLLLPFAIGTALFIETVAALQTRARLVIAAAVVVLTLATYPRAYDTLLRPFTIDYEYEFLRRHILALPSESKIFVLQPPVNDVGLVDANLVNLFVRRDVTLDVWEPLRRQGVPTGTDTYLYIGSACAALGDQKDRPLGADFPRWLHDCTALRTQLAGGAIEEIEVPAHKMSWHEFAEPTVRLGLYRLPPTSNAE